MGLKWLRDRFRHLKIVLWAVVAVFVLLVFVDWGTGRSGRGGPEDVAVRVGERVVTEREFLDEVRRSERQMRDLYGNQWDQLRDQVNLANQTAQRFIQRELLKEEASRLGLVVSDRELQEEIVAMPVFQRSGGGFVGSETYQRVLRANQTTPEAFEAGLREDLLIRKLTTLMERSVWVSDAEVEDSFRRERETADLTLIMIRYEDFLGEVEVDQAALEAYYQERAEQYARPEQRVVRYLAVETSRLRRTLPVEDAELETYYRQHQQEFVEGEQARARHVLIRVDPNASAEARAEAELKAQQVATQARGGIDFAALAAASSDDPATKGAGGDLGWFGRGRMVPEFEEAVFGATPGEVVGPVQSTYGYHVIKVDEFRPERQLPLEEVREQVRFKVLEGRAAAEAETRAAALYQRVKGEQLATDEAWQALADEDPAVVLNLSPPFEVDGSIPGLGDDPDLVRRVFAATAGDVGGPRAVSRGWVVWQLAEVRVAGVPPFDEVRDRVEQEARRGAAVSRAMSATAGVAARWRAGADPASLAEQLRTTVQQATDHRRGTAVASLGLAPGLDRAVFSATEGEVVGPVELKERGAAVARVDRLQVATAAQLATEREAVRSRLESQRAGQLLDALLAERRRDAVVTVNAELVERFAPRPRR